MQSVSAALLADRYALLGVRPGAPLEEVKRAYRRLVRENHPDTGGDGRLVGELKAAYEELAGAHAVRDREARTVFEAARSGETGRDPGSPGLGPAPQPPVDYGALWAYWAATAEPPRALVDVRA
jgi:hypothetical protein